jgi:hypothetical protein
MRQIHSAHAAAACCCCQVSLEALRWVVLHSLVLFAASPINLILHLLPAAAAPR